MRIVVLDAFATDQGDPGIWQPLRGLGEVVLYPRSPVAEIPARGAGAAIVLTNKAPLSAATLAALPDLRYVGVTATGTNIVDLTAAAARGVVVSNVPGYSTAAVAQHVFALVLELTNRVGALAQDVAHGRWSTCPDFCFFRGPIPELEGKTFVIVGMGAIGSRVAAIARAFGMQVLAAQVPGSTAAGRTPLAEALAQAHVVSLHCPLTPATTRLVDDPFLAALRPGALLINTGRGGLLDEPAVARALARGHLGGIGLDVLSSEPPPADHPLLQPQAPWQERVVITPHVAWGAVEARQRLVAESAENVRAFLAGERRNRVA